ncbi:hypothetical protein GCM10028807_14430 [Spirosoma daeguense]
MKSLFLTGLLYLITLTTRGQATVYVDSLPSKGLLLNMAWKWHMGDNSDWAKPQFNDARWDTLTPTRTIGSIHQLPQQGIGWLRIRFHVAPQLRGKPISIILEQSGATELFLNGKLVARNGLISLQKQLVASAYHENIPFVSLNADSVQLLAVRYAFSTQRLPVLSRHFSFLQVSVGPFKLAQDVSQNQLSRSLLETLLFSIFLALGLLQLLLFLASIEQRAALYLGLFLVTQGITHLLAADLLIDVLDVTQVAWTSDLLDFLFTVALAFSGFYYLLGTYHYFKQPKRKPFFVVALLTLVTIPIGIWLPVYKGLAWFILAILLPWSEILRIGILAQQQEKNGAKLFTMAHGTLVAVFLVYTVSVFVPSFSHVLGSFSDNLFMISFLGLALTVSLLVSHERATTNTLLRNQLVKLESLSQKTIAQEKEKQHLLATQNERLEHQVEARTEELTRSLTVLKSTQDQLVHKEKLASLGELTAGIAHEIQNPLNFVNNFSEVSAELIDELKDEVQAGHLNNVLALADDVSRNLQKINHHGGRASSIVKGMLEHSRTESGEKRPTDLASLADEYLKIAYHGLRAKGNEFTCELVTHFDPDLKPVDVAPQEIGRVLLNLYNNAFYAVRERAKQSDNTDYRPLIEVSTKYELGHVVIRVQDNGTGIPKSVKTKIFQPFFTTKPTGEGTGLGLSLSYDIIAKGHGGLLAVESAEGKGTAFVIQLPMVANLSKPQ